MSRLLCILNNPYKNQMKNINQDLYIMIDFQSRYLYIFPYQSFIYLTSTIYHQQPNYVLIMN